MVDLTHDLLFEKKWAPMLPHAAKKAQKPMTKEEVAAYHLEHDGFNRQKAVDAPIIEPFLDQGVAMKEFPEPQELVEN